MNKQQLKDAVSKRILLDLRYFSECTEANLDVTSLPPSWTTLLQRHSLGGVILFAENFANSQQVKKLNDQLQSASVRGVNQAPMLISVDQEGGRVVRSPLQQTTGFSGNMALGAIAGTEHNYAEQTGWVIGSELLSMGLNLNFAPTVDVNRNAKNPVINVRAFGESPQRVAELGADFVKGQQRAGIISALKHFPGHGDTAVDSHLGLPIVYRDRAEAMALDVFPFKTIIERQQPEMIMTAHIQYPSLDSTQLLDKNGRSITMPATLSRAILTDLLREELQFQGVIVTDAMDMGAITSILSAPEATAKAMAAGADMVLMPFRIRCPEDIHRYDQFLDRVVKYGQSLSYFEEEMDDALTRIKELVIPCAVPGNELAQLRCPAHLEVEYQVAANSLVSLDSITPLTPRDWVAITSNTPGVAAMLQVELTHLSIPCRVVYPSELSNTAFSRLIVLSQTPVENAIDWGGVENQVHTPVDASELYPLLEAQIKAGMKPTIVSLRSPYELARFNGRAERLATFSYKSAIDPDTQRPTAPMYRVLAEVLVGVRSAVGHMPVTLETLD